MAKKVTKKISNELNYQPKNAKVMQKKHIQKFPGGTSFWNYN